ncbi:beta-lactamase family protein [Shewanella sp. D64]|uniref:serine hydrolase domain-containing protein n=1 Tax=unclassified Shewanella TaxID=196818 RepID=UPI0022BA46ED|nr:MULTISPECIES: serine hydrolase domain-containing protein [unclassified Shewanella]MEC4728188.1 beta-lactamase family protein [Shewanella sp. D64]MEC4739985.1 beta-lactamase family protein [Shewanella sp. E94]WBJ94343.1 beta-lactamase family protein [Shewanella sp. MTB7]
MRYIKTATMSVTLLLCMAQSGYSHSAEIESSDYQALIESILDKAAVPFSGRVLLSKNGKLLASVTKGEGITLNSSFVMASQSKQITAVLVMQAVDNGKLNLKHTLNHYLNQQGTTKEFPRFAHYDKRITLEQLLSHTSGINHLGKPNLFKPGTKFHYSNLGYTVLAQVLEQINHLSFQAQITNLDQINQLKGISARTGTIDKLHSQIPSLAYGKVETNRKLSPTDLTITHELIPAGGLMSTAPAFARFMHQLHTGKLMSDTSYALMTQAHTTRPHRWPEMNYGYGLQINEQDGIIEYSHSGYLPGYMSLSLHYPQANLDLIVLESTSLSLNDIKRTFSLHDQMRTAIRTLVK